MGAVVVPGLIDLMRIRIDASTLGENIREKFKTTVDKIQRIDTMTGEIKWETNAREIARSDSHQISFAFGSYLEISGSPARLTSTNNVFGSNDVIECFRNMVKFVGSCNEVILPMNPRDWACTCIDYTMNYDMGSYENVLEAIDALKVVKSGRQRLTSRDTSTTWGEGSTLHMGKAYAKGPQLKKLNKNKTMKITKEEIRKADRLLRLEYSIRRKLLSRLREQGINWWDLNPSTLAGFHEKYFSQFISQLEVTDMGTILEQLLANVGVGDGKIPTEGQAHGAYNAYTRCRDMGYHHARSSFPSTTWTRHLKNLRTIGISTADLQPMNVVPLRKRQIVLNNPVSSWDDIQLAM